MKITIITVCFNSAATIADTLHSVAAQTYPEIEHLIIDGGSKDQTLDIIRLHGAHVKQLVSERDGGIYDAMNKGLRLSTGDVVGFLNSDDMLADPQVIERIARALVSPDIDAAYGDLVFVDPADTRRVVRFWRSGLHFKGACVRGWMPPHPTFYARRALLLEIGGFNQQYRLQADFDLMLRLFELRGVRSAYIPSVLVRMRTGGATTSGLGNVIRGNIEAARSCREHGFPGGLRFILTKVARRLPQFLTRPTRA